MNKENAWIIRFIHTAFVNTYLMRGMLVGVMLVSLLSCSLSLNNNNKKKGAGEEGENDITKLYIENPVIYKVTSNTAGEGSTLYMFGSIHKGYKESPYSFPDVLLDKYSTATEVVLEADISIDPSTLAIDYTQETNNNLLKNTGDTRGTILKKYIGTGYWNKLTTIFFRQRTSDVSVKAAKTVEPIHAMRIIDKAYAQASLSTPAVLFDRQTASLGLSSSYGIDNTFLTLAKSQGKNLHYLEEPKDQFAAQFAVDLDEQIETLKANIDKYFGVRLDSCYLKGSFSIESYLSQNQQVFDGLAALNKTCTPSYYSEVLEKRNDKWVAKLDEFMPKNKTYFVVVGILHLSGEDSIVKKMQNMGKFTVTRVSQ